MDCYIFDDIGVGDAAGRISTEGANQARQGDGLGVEVGREDGDADAERRGAGGACANIGQRREDAVAVRYFG